MEQHTLESFPHRSHLQAWATHYTLSMGDSLSIVRAFCSPFLLIYRRKRKESMLSMATMSKVKVSLDGCWDEGKGWCSSGWRKSYCHSMENDMSSVAGEWGMRDSKIKRCVSWVLGLIYLICVAISQGSQGNFRWGDPILFLHQPCEVASDLLSAHEHHDWLGISCFPAISRTNGTSP